MKNIESVSIDLRDARRIAVAGALLANTQFSMSGIRNASEIVEGLGYVQIDTISVVERAHHHTMWTRFPKYQPAMLDDMLTEKRSVFEYWGHAASYLPMRDYRFYLPRMKSFHDPHSKWEKQRLEKYGKYLKPVLERVRDEGPLASKDFAPPKGYKKGDWWDWKPTKSALELLFWQGELMITERRKFQRVYDLTERVLPEWVNTKMPDEEELGRFLVNRCLNSYGLATEKEIADHLHAANRKVVSSSLAKMLEEREIVKLTVKGLERQEYYAFQDGLMTKKFRKRQFPSVHILSPFDNFIIQRERVKRLFGYDYVIECYVPAAKRKYGYFVLPILAGDKLIARMDAKAERKRRTLIVKNLVFEDRADYVDHCLPDLASKLIQFAIFNNCDKTIIEKVTPAKYRQTLSKLVRIC